MQPTPPFYMADQAVPDGSDDRGLYDPEPMPEAELWFLPEPLSQSDLPPLPRADQRSLLHPPDVSRLWMAAEAALARELAGVTLLFGVLDERLRSGPVAGGGRHRLALHAAAEISWAAGDRVAPERLALWTALRLTGPQQDTQALARAGWALRRLEGGPALQIDSVAGLLAFFDRQHLAIEVGDTGVADLVGLAQSLSHLHPVTQAAALFQGWPILGGDTGHGESAQADVVRHIEAAVLAARLGARMGARSGAAVGAVFLPLGLTGFAAEGSVQDRLALWLGRVGQAIRAALRHLDQIALWQVRAQAGMAGAQGRTPDLLIGVLVAWPQVTAAMAEELTGAARATVQRNLARLQAAGLIREVTGQGRYRVWSAKL